MSFRLQWDVSISTSFWITLPQSPAQSNNFKGRRFNLDGFDVASTEMGQHGRIFVFIEIQRQGIIPSPMYLC